AAIEAVIGKAPEAAGIAAEPYPISSAIAKAELTSGYAATGVRLLHYGDENARYEAFLKVDDQLQISDVVAFSGTTGAPVPATAPGLEKQTVAEVVLNALVALHYATYGGIWLKVLYIGLGLALCVMVGTGLMVWVERRANGPTGRLARSTYLLMGRFNTGCMMGLPVATALVFYADRLIQVAADARITMIGSVYLGTWCVVALMGTIVRNPRWWFRVTLGLSGALAMGILPLDALTLGEGSLFDSAQSLALAFDLGLALLGSLALVVALNLEGFAVKPLPARGSGPLQAVVQAQER
ncbi:MAG: PepSY-associated TM helix domain-containing protein, partial [Pseudomonadota bacterium]